jgi:hypothetical protein
MLAEITYLKRVWFGGFGYSDNFEYTLLDLLANCNKIENVDYSKFIVYIMLSKFCLNMDRGCSKNTNSLTQKDFFKAKI